MKITIVTHLVMQLTARGKNTAMAKKTVKTNAMRQLDTAGILYEAIEYACDDKNFDGELVARQVGLSGAQVFKTLVTRDEKGGVVVGCVPVDRRLDLKALAEAAGCKRLEMTRPDELLALTGYMRGGCSPVGMKKRYPTYIDRSALEQEKIAISAGMRGLQLYLSPGDLIRHTGAKTDQLVHPE